MGSFLQTIKSHNRILGTAARILQMFFYFLRLGGPFPSPPTPHTSRGGQLLPRVKLKGQEAGEGVGTGGMALGRGTGCLRTAGGLGRVVPALVDPQGMVRWQTLREGDHLLIIWQGHAQGQRQEGCPWSGMPYSGPSLHCMIWLIPFQI